MSVPKSLQPAFDGIEPLITDYCNQYLNDEYRNCVCICSKSSAERGLHRYWQEERTRGQRLSSMLLQRITLSLTNHNRFI